MLSQPQTNDWEFADHVEPIWQPKRIKILKGGRGGVKSWTAARYHLIDGFQQKLRVLCGREIQRSIKESVHQLLSDQVELLGLGGFYEVMANEIRGRNGTRFTYAGISQLTTDSIKSYEGYDRFWGEESHTFSRRSLDILTPTFRKDGSELMFTMNPELDTDEIWVRYIENPDDDVLVLDCSYDNNPWFPDVLEKERKAFLRQVTQGKRRQYEYDWIWEGKCKPAVEGAIYGDEVLAVKESGRLCPVPYDPQLAVHLILDLGWADSMAIGAVQAAAGSVRFIDYIEDNHRTYDSYILGDNDHQGILDKPYAKRIKNIWLPHDGKAKNPQTGKSAIEIVTELVKETNIKVPKDGVPDIGKENGIKSARQMFPRCYFDKSNCTTLYNRLRRYARNINTKTDEPMGTKQDLNAHGSDMFRYVAVIEKELTNEKRDMKPIKYSNQGIV